jgi:uncharacterized iron-regulated protein
MIRILVLLFSFFVLNFSPVFSDTNQDTLPIGNSKYKFFMSKIEKNQIIETSTNKVVSISDIVNKNFATDVFIIGEYHDNYECHKFQKEFIEALHRKYPKIVVGFEFFLRNQNSILERWSAGNITEDELLKKVGWYKRNSLSYGYTKMIMDVIKKNKIKAIGLNIDRKIVHKVATMGLKSLSKEERRLFPTINIYNREHEYFIKTIFAKIAIQVPLWFKNMYNAQKCWDVIMAESMRKILSMKKYKNYKGVIIAGSAHVTYKLGIPFRYKAAKKSLRSTTIVPVHLPLKKDKSEGQGMSPMMKMIAGNLKPVAIFSRGLGDYIFSVPQSDRSYFPVLGIRGSLNNNQFVISKVNNGSIAEKNGIKKGDIIISINGNKMTSIEQLRLLMLKKNWNDLIGFKIIKNIKIEK